MKLFFHCVVSALLAIGAMVSVIAGFYVEYQFKLRGIHCEGGYVFGGILAGAVMTGGAYEVIKASR